MTPPNLSKYSAKKKDAELRRLASTFFNSFQKATTSNHAEIARIIQTKRFSFFSGGAVELTDEVLQARRLLVGRASKLLGPKVANEKQLTKIVTTHAQEFIAKRHSHTKAIEELIDRIFAEGETEYTFVISNHIVKFTEGVRDFKISRVKALYTEGFSKKHNKKFGKSLILEAAPKYSVEYSSPIKMKLYGICWEVQVATSKPNVPEEAKWLIDVAMSFLRYSYKEMPHRYPGIGEVEPSPTSPIPGEVEGLTTDEYTWSFGGERKSGIYLVNKKTRKILQSSKIKKKAELIFNPPEKSLAERVGQGLGWLSRGRQSEDKAERLLHFFTAIEALLTTDDKSAPVVQTVARHGSVIIADSIHNRPHIADKMKELYAARSSLVHAGNRNVLMSSVDTAQYFAETMFAIVLDKCDMGMKYADFGNQLSVASYGLKWSPN